MLSFALPCNLRESIDVEPGKYSNSCFKVLQMSSSIECSSHASHVKSRLNLV